ncbi:MAG: class I SAM-dependent methyltransferase, partial [Chloroflexi bacterium]|nr:class I SAM-dependent methyltransferase [Chloroflexota bacterium]
MSEAHIFSAEYYARLAAQEEMHWWSIGMRATATRLLDGIASPARDWRVLDAGCGTGLTLKWLARYTDVEPVGLDLARAGLQFCARRGARRLIEGSTTTLPFASGAFDLAVSLDVIQHLPRPTGDAQAFAEFARVLTAQGWLLLRTNSRCGYPHTDAVDYHRYTLGEVRTLAQRAGFRLHAASYANCVPALIASARMRLARANGSADPGLRAVARPPHANVTTRI